MIKVTLNITLQNSIHTNYYKITKDSTVVTDII